MQKWTQEQAVAFEAARECITALMAVHTAALATEKNRPDPRSTVVQELRGEIARLFAERSAMRVTDDETVARVLSTYGPQVRAAMERERARQARSPAE